MTDDISCTCRLLGVALFRKEIRFAMYQTCASPPFLGTVLLEAVAAADGASSYHFLFVSRQDMAQHATP